MAFLVAFVGSAILTGILVKWLPQLGLVDHPNERSSHTKAVPRGGGIAVALSTVIGYGTGQWGQDAEWGLVLALTMAVALGIVGLVDDKFDLSPILRLVLQLITGVGLGLALVWSGAEAWIVVVCAAATVVVVNAVNFMDGINGITAVTAAIAFVAYGGFLLDATIQPAAALSFAIAGALLGFLGWNLRGLVFLGDVGSYFVGAIWTLVAASVAVHSGEPILALGPLVVYIADVAWSLVNKAASHRPLFEAHRSHVYQRLTDVGLSHPTVTVVVGTFTGLCSLAAYSAVLVGRPWLGWAVLLALATIYLCLPRFATRARPSLPTESTSIDSPPPAMRQEEHDE